MAEFTSEPRPSGGQDSNAPPPRRWRALPWLFALVFLLALIWVLVNPGIADRVRQLAYGAGIRGESPAGSVASAPSVDVVAAADQPLTALDERVGRLEQQSSAGIDGKPGDEGADPSRIAALAARVTALESQTANLASADVSLTSRIESLSLEVQRVGGTVQASDAQIRELFLLSVARRSVQAGRNISSLMDLLHRTYQHQFPAAVDALATWSARPQSRADLASRVKTLPTVEQAPVTTGSWWNRLQARVTGFLSASGAGPADDSTVDLALTARGVLDNGDLASAITAIERLPAGGARDTWLEDARRLWAAEQALDLLEDSAIGRTIDNAAAAAPAPTAPAASLPPALNAPEAMGDPVG